MKSIVAFLVLVAVASTAATPVPDTLRQCAEDNNVSLKVLQKAMDERDLPEIQTVSEEFKGMMKCIMQAVSFITPKGEINEGMNDIPRMKNYYKLMKAVPKSDNNLDYVYAIAKAVSDYEIRRNKNRSSSEEKKDADASEEKTNTISS